MNRSGWKVGYRSGWSTIVTGGNLDIEDAITLAVEGATETGISHNLFPPDGSAGRSIKEARELVFGAAPAAPVREPMTAPGLDRAWADGPGAAQ